MSCDNMPFGDGCRKEVGMKRNLIVSFLLTAGALIGLTGPAGASLQSGPEILFGRIEKVEDNGFVIQSVRGQFMKLQLSKDTNVVCSNGSQAMLMTSRQGSQEQSELPVSPAEEQTKSHNSSEAVNKDVARGSGFLVGGPDCHFKPGDLVRVEASDAGTITTITRLPYEEAENGSQVATEKEQEPSTSAQ
jgi:hypothetical protein